MDKPANTDVPVHELIARRWSPLAFADRPVPSEVLHSLFEAARWAPSSFNGQPWSFMVGSTEMGEAHVTLASCLSEGNRPWAVKAPVLALSVANMRFDHNHKDNRHAFHDVGLAVGNLVVQATAMGVAVHQMAGFDREKARTLLRIPEGHEPVAMLAIGYRGDPETLSEDLKQRELKPRSRKPASSFVFGGEWGRPLKT